MRILAIVSARSEAKCYVGAGAIRDAVWDHISGVQGPTKVKDIDLVFHDEMDTSEQRDLQLERVLQELEPSEQWEVTNQAGVHLWFHKKFGYKVEPLRSLEEAVSTWPEYASCIAVRLDKDEEPEIIAPRGLVDLVEMRVRRNPVRVTAEGYRRRIATKRYKERWPRMTVVPG